MRSARPKVLHRVAGRTLLEAVLAAAEGVEPARVVVVVGAGREQVAASLEGRAVTLAVQDPPLGTGDAARTGAAALALDRGDRSVVVLAGDTPLLRAETLRGARRAPSRATASISRFSRSRRRSRATSGASCATRAGACSASSRRGTRRRGSGASREVNAGVYCFAPEALARALAEAATQPTSAASTT